MSVSDPLRHLADIVEGIEAQAMEVTHVSMPDGANADGGSAAEVGLTIPFCSAFGDRSTVRLRSSQLEDDGSLGLAFETSDPLVSHGDRDVESQLLNAELTEDGSIRARLELSLSPPEPTAGTTDHDEPAAETTDHDEPAAETTDHDETGEPVGTDSPSAPDPMECQVVDEDVVTPRSGRSDDVPPFRDRDLLAEVYESCDTFAEMKDALGMDVTAETVRRYMIDHGIHEPTPYDTSPGDGGNAGDGTRDRTEGLMSQPGVDGGPTESEAALEDEGRIVLTDGIGLPDDIEVDRFVEAVKDSRTIYEVTREIGISREDTVDTLRAYNLLDLVGGRLSGGGRSEVTREEVVQRLRECTSEPSTAG